MINKAKTALIAAFVLGSASAALAQATGEEFQNSQYQLNPAAPVPLYSQSVPQGEVYARAPQRNLIEGRNVATGRAALARPRPAAPARVDPLQSFGGY